MSNGGLGEGETSFPPRYKQGSHFFSDDIWNQGGCPLQQALDFTEK